MVMSLSNHLFLVHWNNEEHQNNTNNTKEGKDTKNNVIVQLSWNDEIERVGRECVHIL